MADEFYGPYAWKLYGLDPADLHPELAQRRIAAASPADIARRLRGEEPFTLEPRAPLPE